MRMLLGVCLGLLLRLWIATLRVRVLRAPEPAGDPRPVVLAFWHGQQMLLLRWPRPRPTAVMVSLSKDGQLQSGVLSAHGFRIVRGSSSRRGAAALVEIVRLLKTGLDAAFAVDGPRGPLGTVKAGALRAAALSNARVVPLGAAGHRRRVLRRTWDQFEIPAPFSRVVIAAGPSCHGAVTAEELQTAIEAQQRRAHGELRRWTGRATETSREVSTR